MGCRLKTNIKRLKYVQKMLIPVAWSMTKAVQRFFNFQYVRTLEIGQPCGGLTIVILFSGKVG
jgi:hypothetical protein